MFRPSTTPKGSVESFIVWQAGLLLSGYATANFVLRITDSPSPGTVAVQIDQPWLRTVLNTPDVAAIAAMAVATLVAGLLGLLLVLHAVVVLLATRHYPTHHARLVAAALVVYIVVGACLGGIVHGEDELTFWPVFLPSLLGGGLLISTRVQREPFLATAATVTATPVERTAR